MKFDFFDILKYKPSIGLLFLIQLLILFFIGLLSITIFIELGEEVSEKSLIVALDDYIINRIHEEKYPLLEKSMAIITHFASWQMITIISIVLFMCLLYKKYYYLAVQITLITVGSFTMNVTLKSLFNRPRPEGNHAVEVISSSFPSGHSMTGIAVYGFIIYMLWVIIKEKSAKTIYALLLLLLILLIGFSRIYLNVHYPSDVIGGFAAGLFWLVFCISIVHVSRFLMNRWNK